MARPKTKAAKKRETNKGVMVDFEEMKDALRIDRHNLDDMLEQQPMLFQQVGEELSYARSRADAAKDHLDLIEAELDRRIRDEAEEEGEKVTEKAVKASIQRHEERIDAFNALLDAKFMADQWSGLLSSFRQRGFALGELANLYVSGYSQSDSAGSARSATRETRAERNRARLSKKRRNRTVED